MNVNKFLNEFPEVLGSEHGDGIFDAIKIQTSGQSCSRVGKFLNFSVRCLDQDESYLEIGTFTGFTLVSALYRLNNGGIGVDNFDFEFGGDKEMVRQTLYSNLAKLPGNYALVEKDFRKLKHKDINNIKIGCFFIDGNHTYEDVKDAFKWAEPFLADKAIIVVDDLRIGGVDRAVLEQLSDQYALKFWCMTNIAESQGRFIDPYFDNGLGVLLYEKN